MITYITKQGDMLDAICYQYYQSEFYLVKVLEANRNLSNANLSLDANEVIQLPDITLDEIIPLRLW
ncbi:tail protein X [Thiotrichales bacterium 19S3-7]|nr:tail protein X [Thiotrichales bacterium 19S3-7]MCF6801289.1 tail protein X [Thiotrichales bacterium 19S3-11]